MSYTLEQLATECRTTLESDAGPSGREIVRELVGQACSDTQFVATHFGDDNHEQRKLLFQDDKLGFCIFAHAYEGASDSQPHDHGPSWAIYGQARGETHMFDWRIVKTAEVGGKHGVAEVVQKYTLKPGDAYLYNEGDIHSPERADSTRLIRIEGVNMDHVKRSWYKPQRGS